LPKPNNYKGKRKSGFNLNDDDNILVANWGEQTRGCPRKLANTKMDVPDDDGEERNEVGVHLFLVPMHFAKVHDDHYDYQWERVKVAII